jgi:hypothetical protein
MQLVYVAHIIAGSLALLSGYTALYSAKGAVVHRRSGIVFVHTMLLMCVAGTTLSAVRGIAPATNIPAALITSYLVITSFLTVKPLPRRSLVVEMTLMCVALGVGLANAVFAYQAFTSLNGMRNGMPPFPFVLFGSVGLLAGAADLRVLRFGPLTGRSRIARHLWRMSFALLIAALSFFVGQAKVFPEKIRILPLLAVPVIGVLLTMLYWLWRVRFRRTQSLVMMKSGAPSNSYIGRRRSVL